MRRSGLLSIMSAIGTLTCLLSAPPVAAQWQPNDLPISTAAGNQSVPHVVSDGAGGVIIFWFNQLQSELEPPGPFIREDIFAQRVNAAGVPQWADNGVPIATQASPSGAVSDGAGGAIVMWNVHSYSAGTSTVYAQRVNAAGIPQWSVNGVVLRSSEGSSQHHALAGDGAGGRHRRLG